MKAKEKALELIEKMFSNMPKYLQGKIGSETAKQCALICVDEVLEELGEELELAYNYWTEVKQDLNLVEQCFYL